MTETQESNLSAARVRIEDLWPQREVRCGCGQAGGGDGRRACGRLFQKILIGCLQLSYWRSD